MVVFTCNNCGDSLQKPRVAKHYQFQCRNSISLTCVDCFKDFLGDEYVAHTKCITEAERYGSKDYVPKASANKAERKQQEWIKTVNNVINGANNLSTDERNILNHISKHENIPRKKVKFINFVKSSMGYRVNINAVENCWTRIETVSNEIAKNNKSLETQQIKNNIDEIPKNIDTIKNNNDNEVINIKENDKKKSKKRKHNEINSHDNDIKLSKIELNHAEIKSNDNQSTDEQQLEKQEENNSKIKFDWDSCILRVLGTKNEIPLKKLEKKVVAKYLKYSDKLSNDKVVTRFYKKLSKISEINSDGDVVKRVN